jgi:hypothetical protein
MSKKNVSNEELGQASGGQCGYPATVDQIGADFIDYTYGDGTDEKRRQNMNPNDVNTMENMGLAVGEGVFLAKKRKSFTFKGASFETGSSEVLGG